MLRIEEHTLSNGLRLITIPMLETNSVSVAVTVKVGSRNEEFKTHGGVSHFLEHLFFKGSKKRPTPRQIMSEIDSLGGVANASTSFEYTNFYVKVPMEFMDKALDVLGDMLVNPLLNKAEIDRERNVVLEEMNVVKDDPSRYVYDLVPPLLWPNSRLGQEVLGDEEVIKSISKEAIESYKQRHYTTANMVVAVAGNLDAQTLIAKVEKHFGEIGKGSVDERHAVSSKLAPDKVAMLAKDTNQTHFVIAARSFEARHKKDPAVQVLTNILGEGFSSRLFMNVREKKGLAYSVYAVNSAYSDSGAFEVYAGVNNDKTDAAIEAVLQEFSKVRNELVSQKELQKAKTQIRGRTLLSLENNLSAALRYGGQLSLLGSIVSSEEYLAKIEKVTLADVQKVAAEILAPERLRMAIIAPKPQEAVKKFEQLVRS